MKCIDFHRLRSLSNRLLLNSMALLLGVGAVGFVSLGKAFAATSMSHVSVMQYNMNASTATTLAIDFTTGAADAATSLSIVFSAGTASSPTVTTTGCTSLFPGSAVLPGTTFTGSTGSSSTITINAITAPLTTATNYCAIITGGFTNPAAGQFTATLTEGSDSGTVGLDAISGDTETVSAVVPPTFTMSLSGSTDAFVSNLSLVSDVTTTGVTATMSTNAANGWLLWAEDSTGGLHSSTASYTIPSALTAGSNYNFTANEGIAEAYGIGIASITSGSPVANYSDTAGHHGSALSSTAFNEIASYASPISSDGVLVKELADIKATTPAASNYTDIVTLVGAGSF